MCIFCIGVFLKKKAIINNCLLYLGDKNMETRLRDIERKMESMKEKSGEDQVEECLRQVRI